MNFGIFERQSQCSESRAIEVKTILFKVLFRKEIVVEILVRKIYGGLAYFYILKLWDYIRL